MVGNDFNIIVFLLVVLYQLLPFSLESTFLVLCVEQVMPGAELHQVTLCTTDAGAPKIIFDNLVPDPVRSFCKHKLLLFMTQSL